MLSSRFAYVLMAGTALCGCASNNLPPEHPGPPKMAQAYAPPPMPPVMMATPQRKKVKRGRVGSSNYVEAKEDHTYRVNVGMGGATSGPQQVSVELPAGYQLRQVVWPNKELMEVESALVGSARDGRYVIFFRPKHDTGGPRVENVSIATDKGLFQVDVHVQQGRANNLTLKLQAPEGDEPSGQIMAGEPLCLDNNFSWERKQWWAPMSVCASVSPTGVYSTTINFPPNIRGGQMPIPMGWRDLGDGNGAAMALNYRVNGTAMSIDGMHNVVQLTGAGAPIYIFRGEH